MIIFGSELRHHPKLEKYIKFAPLVIIAKLYLRILGTFGITGAGDYLRSVYFRKCLKEHELEFKSVLDAGCSLGNFSFFLAKKNPHVIVNGCDFNEDSINAAKYIAEQAKIKNANFFTSDLVKLSKHDSYDFIFSIDVLDEIEDDEKVIENFANALKKGGHLLIHVPQKKECYISKDWHEKQPEYVRRYAINEISQLLERNGFEVIEKLNTFGVFGETAYKFDFLLSSKYLKVMFAIPLNCISYFDFLIRHKKGGGGLLILAFKKSERENATK